MELFYRNLDITKNYYVADTFLPSQIFGLGKQSKNLGGLVVFLR